MPTPIETVYDKIWTLLDGHAALTSLITRKYKFDSREQVPPANPTSAQLPDLMVTFDGGPAGNLRGQAQGPWFSELVYSVLYRTDTMNPRTCMDILWEIMNALTASSTNFNLDLTGTVTMVDFTNINVDFDDEADVSRWTGTIEMMVHFATNPT